MHLTALFWPPLWVVSPQDTTSRTGSGAQWGSREDPSAGALTPAESAGDTFLIRKAWVEGTRGLCLSVKEPTFLEDMMCELDTRLPLAEEQGGRSLLTGWTAWAKAFRPDRAWRGVPLAQHVARL